MSTSLGVLCGPIGTRFDATFDLVETVTTLSVFGDSGAAGLSDSSVRLPRCTTGSVDIVVNASLVTVADPTGFTVGARVVLRNAIGTGQDLVTTIASISGNDITLTDAAAATVTDEEFCLLSSSGRWFGPSGDCGCDCGEVACLVCTSDTPGDNFSITISDLTITDVCTGCAEVRQGTFVLTRPIPGTCRWSRLWTAAENYNCQLFDPTDYIYIGSLGTLFCFGSGYVEYISLEITGRQSSGFDVVVTIENIYVSQTTPAYATRWTTIYSGQVVSCADLAGYVVPFASSSHEDLPIQFGSPCVESASSVGDFCLFDNATITLVG